MCRDERTLGFGRQRLIAVQVWFKKGGKAASMAMAAAAKLAAVDIQEQSQPSDWTMVTSMPQYKSTLCEEELMMACLSFSSAQGECYSHIEEEEERTNRK